MIEENALDKAGQQIKYPFGFTGTGGQFFKIWIVNIMLTIVTFYIYSAWAKVRTKRYFYGNTVLDGSSFEYHAKPLQILLSRMIAAVLFIAVTIGGGFLPWISIVATLALFLIIPWAIWRSVKFNMRMSSYRNVRFGFDGSVWPMYLYQFLIPLVIYLFAAGCIFAWVQFSSGWISAVALAVCIVAMLLWLSAYTHKKLSTYFLNHYLYGKSRFSGQLSMGYFFKTYIVAVMIALALFALPLLIAYILYGENILNYLDEFSRGENPEELPSVFFAIIFSLYAFFFLVGYLMAAMIRARIRNHVFNMALLDKRVQFHSDLPILKLWWVIFSNVLLIFITTGLARPFTQIRLARLYAKHTTAISTGPLDQFVGEKRDEISAFGDEIGDAFDMDMDVGF